MQIELTKSDVRALEATRREVERAQIAAESEWLQALRDVAESHGETLPTKGSVKVLPGPDGRPAMLAWESGEPAKAEGGSDA